MSCSLQSPLRLTLSRDTEEGAPLTGRAPFLCPMLPQMRCCTLTVPPLRMRSALKHSVGTHAIFPDNPDIAGRSSRRPGGRSNWCRPRPLWGQVTVAVKSNETTITHVVVAAVAEEPLPVSPSEAADPSPASVALADAGPAAPESRKLILRRMLADGLALLGRRT